MKTKLLAIILFVFALNPLRAQTLKGTVTESGSGERMSNVFVHDMNSKAITLTDKKGKFEIRTAIGHTLILASPGYVSDTLFVADMEPKRIKLLVANFTLRQVNITSTRTYFNPREEYPEVYRKSKVYVLSPTTWFSKEAKNARRLKHYFEREEKERHIDSVFSKVYVSSLIPLRGEELEDFMTLYRPSYEYVVNNNGPSMAVYINDSYKKFMALPPEKRKVEQLAP